MDEPSTVSRRAPSGGSMKRLGKGEEVNETRPAAEAVADRAWRWRGCSWEASGCEGSRRRLVICHDRDAHGRKEASTPSMAVAARTCQQRDHTADRATNKREARRRQCTTDKRSYQQQQPFAALSLCLSSYVRTAASSTESTLSRSMLSSPSVLSIAHPACPRSPLSALCSRLFPSEPCPSQSFTCYLRASCRSLLSSTSS